MISADGVGVTVGALLARVADAGVVQLAQQTWNTKQKNRLYYNTIIT